MEFSVVIPLYNKEKHISRAINSVLNQTTKEFELIIVDDGSEDFSVMQVEKFTDPRIRLIKQSNSGVSSARNKGIELARYEYIGFLDADDAWEPNFLETIENLIKRYPDAGVFATAYQFADNCYGRTLPENILSIPINWEGIVDDYFRLALKKSLISASSVVIPKRTFTEVGMFHEGLKRGEDLEMWCRIALNYDIAFSNKACATYFLDASNRACNKKVVLSYSFSNIAEDILKRGRSAKNYSIYFEEYMIRILINKARLLIDENRRIEAIKLLYKYRYTKYNKKELVKTYIRSFLPQSIIYLISLLKRKLIKLFI